VFCCEGELGELDAERVVFHPGNSAPQVPHIASVGSGAVLDFFVYSRDAPGTAGLRDDHELLEQHWAYMDGFAESMIARGPTFRTDRETVTGSLHVLGLPSVDAVQQFVAREPNNRAGLYAEHFVWRFDNVLGRTMWEFPRTGDDPMYLLIARRGRLESLAADVPDRLILYGSLATLADAQPAGIALALQARERVEVEALFEGLDGFQDVEIHDWEFGGRR
jgi:uncharacterized protein YciI